MKLKFINASYKNKIVLNNTFFKLLSKTFKKNSSIAVFCSVQFLDSLNVIKSEIEKLGFKVISLKTERAFYENQILGCNSYLDNLNLPKNIEGFVYIGDGNFHPLALVYAQENLEKFIPVLVYNPSSEKSEIYSKDLIEKNFKKRKGNLLKFHTSKKVGVFISSKWGQEYLNSALKLKLMYADKKFYFFIGDNFNEEEMDNFNYIDVWVNTACPRIGQDDVIRQTKAVVNIKDIWK